MKSNAAEAGQIARFARRTRLIREKLDPQAGWVEHRHPVKDANGKLQYCVEVVRTLDYGVPKIVKSMGGFMSRLQKHETSAYLAVWQESEKLKRVATFQQLSAEGDQKIIVLKDYGPSLEDWFLLAGPPRLHPDFRDPSQPLLNSPISPWLAPAVLLALARSLLEALEPFHALGFVHCDAKADNFCIRFNTTTQMGPALSGEIDLDTLTAIDLGCSLLSMSHARCIYLTEEGGAPLYIGAYREHYIWPVLMGGAADAATARLVAQRYAGGEFPRELNTTGSRDARKKRLGETKARDLGYISDNYLLACEMAALGELSALVRLDWRVDFFSLGQLLKNLRRNLTHEGRELAAAAAPVMDYLDVLPNRLQAYDTCPYTTAPALPHRHIVEEINALIGKEQHRRIPFSIVEAANPIPWYEAAAESPFSDLIADGTLPPPLAASETLLRTRSGDKGNIATRRPFEEFKDVDERWCPVVVFIPKKLPDMQNIKNNSLATSIAVSKDPITVDLFAEFMEQTRRNERVLRVNFKKKLHPVTKVSREDCEAWISWLNECLTNRLLHSSHVAKYRLLTAEEWMYCSQCGSKSEYVIGGRCCEDIRQGEAIYKYSEPNKKGERWHDSTNRVEPQPVDHPWNQVNIFGLRGLHGNIWEIVSTANNASSTELKGGSYASPPRELAATYRRNIGISERGPDIGFRICRDISPFEIELAGAYS